MLAVASFQQISNGTHNSLVGCFNGAADVAIFHFERSVLIAVMEWIHSRISEDIKYRVNIWSMVSCCSSSFSRFFLALSICCRIPKVELVVHK